MIFACFDRIRIINLAYRRDRRREMEEQLRRVGLHGDPRVSYFPAIRPDHRGDFTSIGARGVYESQRTILREASETNESVLIVEDDCDFTPGAAGYFAPRPWDIFYGGYMASDQGDLLAADIIGAHLMGFSARGAALVSAYLSTLRYEGIHPPIDAAYVWYRRAHPETPTLFAEPPLGHQRSSRTDIADLRFYDRWAALRPLAGLARRARRTLRS